MLLDPQISQMAADEEGCAFSTQISVICGSSSEVRLYAYCLLADVESSQFAKIRSVSSAEVAEKVLKAKLKPGDTEKTD